MLYDSIHGKLFTLPEEVFVYPSHNYRGHAISTIGTGKCFNPRLLGHDRQGLIEFMDSVNLPGPKKIMGVVPAKQPCGQRAVAV
ncbi:hypothetical protein D082_26740 [Synechocystis sp. PCC 6714]|nr:hypothetical protein D082_26740 [Synechocystis sp. PCC 6714]